MSEVFTFFKGRVALYAILKSIGISSGDEVILPGFTCVVVPNAIKYTGAKPVYVDINPIDYNIDVNRIEEKINAKTKVIIAQHTFGIPADMDKIRSLTKRYNIYLVEDACHVLGSRYQGVEVGLLGDAAFFSSQWSKPITTGLGGWAVINDETLIAKMREQYGQFISPSGKEQKLIKLQYDLYNSLMTPKIFWFAQSLYRNLSNRGLLVGSSTDDELEYQMPYDYPKKMGMTQEKLLFSKLMDKDKVIAHRKKITQIYADFFPIEYDRLIKDGVDTVFLRFPLLVEDKIGILDLAKEYKVEIGDWFLSPLHPNMTGWEKVDYEKGDCPIAEEVCKHIINLPTHEKITEKEAVRIATFVKKYRGNYEYTIS
ncbi:MAG: aminotransferase class I/II-fold pyridoxal phosphate-dependent enzyme [Deferribacterales bacterium]